MDNETKRDLNARSTMAVGMVLDAVTTHESQAGRVYQFPAGHALADLTAKGWAALLSVEVGQ